MDPLSISASIVALGNALFQISDAIKDFVQSAKQVDGLLESMRSDTESLSSILNAFKTVYEDLTAQPALEAAGKGTGILRGSVLASIQDCQDTVTELHAVLKAVAGLSESNSFFSHSVRQVRLNKKQVDIDKIQMRMQTHKINLQMSLQMLNL